MRVRLQIEGGKKWHIPVPLSLAPFMIKAGLKQAKRKENNEVITILSQINYHRLFRTLKKEIKEYKGLVLVDVKSGDDVHIQIIL
ncbi:MAG: hypothetical protein ACI35O_15875 [Bacillaceae bacterium]